MEIMLYNRLVIIETVAGESFEDAYIEAAYFDDSYFPLSDVEMGSVAAMYPEAVSERWFQGAVERAEARAEWMER